MKYFSTFAGIGGFELGIQRSIPSAQCVGYSEIDRHAVTTYERHFTHDNHGDITAINAGDLPDFDLFVGGFPCQAFSVAGRRQGFGDTRGTLFFDVARILAAKQPEHFILENVRGLLHHDSGRTARTIIRTLAELGYCVEWRLLNSKNFGVPQSRERVYFVGHLGGIPERPIFTPEGPCNPYSTVGLTTKTTVARTLTGGGNSGGNHSGMTIIRTSAGDRRLTPVEQERLHGFPDNWTAGVSDTQRFKQCGNAVSPPVVSHIAGRLQFAGAELVGAGA